MNKFSEKYDRHLLALQSNPPKGFVVMRMAFHRDDGTFAMDFTDYECVFAAEQLWKRRIESVLDIGSYRQFVFGLAASYSVTSVDIRPFEAKQLPPSLDIIVGEAKDAVVPFNSFDAVTSLCSIEHFGLGRYGDEFDLAADTKAVIRMKKALCHGGMFIFSVPVSRGKPAIMYNAHRIYSYQMIERLCDELELEEEMFLNRHTNEIIPLDEVTEITGDWAVYMGCWSKP